MTDKERAIKYSPCNGRCWMEDDGFCRGCVRTEQEVVRWLYLDEKQRKKVINEIPKRRKNEIPSKKR